MSGRKRLWGIVVVISILAASVGQTSESQAAATGVVYVGEMDRAEVEATADEISALQPILSNEHRANFGGMWVDEGGTPHLAIARGDGRIVMAAKSGLSKDPVMHEVAFTVDELTAMQDDLAAAARADGFRLEGATVSSIEQDIVNNQVIVHLVKPTRAQKDAVASRFERGVVAVETTEPDRQRRATNTTARVR